MNYEGLTDRELWQLLFQKTENEMAAYADITAPFAPVSRCVRLWGREWHLCTPDRHRRCLPPLSPRLWGTVPGTCLFDKSTR